MKTYISALFLMLLLLGNAQAQNLQQISDRLYQAMGKLDAIRPKAMISGQATYPVSFSADGSQLMVHPKLVEFLRQSRYSKLEEEILAGMMGLAMYRQLSQQPDNEETSKQGVFLTLMAGYRTEVLGSFWRGLDPAEFPQGTVSPSEKGKWIARTNGKAIQMDAAFQLASFAIITEQYGTASSCYQTILDLGYTGREIYNNAAVSILMEYMKNAAQAIPIYPVDLELTSRLAGASSGSRSLETSNLERAEKLLDTAISKDPTYSSAYLNRACVRIILTQQLGTGSFDRAMSDAKKGAQLTNNTDQQAKSKLIQGLISMYQQQYDQALALFQEAQRSNNKTSFRKMIKYNQALLYVQQLNLPTDEQNKLWKELKYYAKDLSPQKKEAILQLGSSLQPIFDRKLYKALVQAKPQNMALEDEKVNGVPISRFSLELYEKARQIINTDNFSIWTYKSDKTDLYYHLSDSNKEIKMVCYKTKDGYDQATAQQIRVGSHISEVIQKYGRAEPIPLSLHQTSVLPYPNLGLAFFLSADKKVESWMVYDLP